MTLILRRTSPLCVKVIVVHRRTIVVFRPIHVPGNRSTNLNLVPQDALVVDPVLNREVLRQGAATRLRLADVSKCRVKAHGVDDCTALRSHLFLQSFVEARKVEQLERFRVQRSTRERSVDVTAPSLMKTS